jgi:hypothetical protein
MTNKDFLIPILHPVETAPNLASIAPRAARCKPGAIARRFARAPAGAIIAAS